jgi:hypothetical protein
VLCQSFASAVVNFKQNSDFSHQLAQLTQVLCCHQQVQQKPGLSAPCLYLRASLPAGQAIRNHS